VKEWIVRILTASGFVSTYGAMRRKLTGSQVAILMYHRIVTTGDNWSLNGLSTDAFERQLAYIIRNYEVIPLEQLAGCLANGDWPAKAVVITFDDGYKDNFRNAFPLLKKYNMPATIFLTTGCIDTGELLWFDKVGYALWHTSKKEICLGKLGRYNLGLPEHKIDSRNKIVRALKTMPEEEKLPAVLSLIEKCAVSIPEDQGKTIMLSWDEVREMAAGGVSFGAHGVSHAILTNVSREQSEKEISQSKAEIETRVSKQVSAFSYPNGNCSPELMALVRENGSSCAVSSKPYVGRRSVKPGDNPFALNRMETRDLSFLKMQLSGLVGDIEGLLKGGIR